MCLAKSSMFLAICKANSRVGDKIIACVLVLLVSICSKIGKLKAAVLPVPVCAKAFKSSLEAITCGIAFS